MTILGGKIRLKTTFLTFYLRIRKIMSTFVRELLRMPKKETNDNETSNGFSDDALHRDCGRSRGHS